MHSFFRAEEDHAVSSRVDSEYHAQDFAIVVLALLKDVESLVSQRKVTHLEGFLLEHLPQILCEESAFADVDIGLFVVEEVPGSGEDDQVLLVEEGLLLQLLAQVGEDRHVLGRYLALEVGQRFSVWLLLSQLHFQVQFHELGVFGF